MIDQDKRLHLLAMYAQVAALFSGLPVSLAGGYPRDIILGREPKDIDVLVERSRMDDGDFDDHSGTRYIMRRAAEMLGQKGFKTTSEHGYGDAERLYAVYELHSDAFPVPLNVIFTEDINGFLNDHPDTLSQVSVEADDVYVSEGFEHAVERKKVYTRLPLYSPRVQRLSQKYPDYEWEYMAESAFARGFGAWV